MTLFRSLSAILDQLPSFLVNPQADAACENPTDTVSIRFRFPHGFDSRTLSVSRACDLRSMPRQWLKGCGVLKAWRLEITCKCRSQLPQLDAKAYGKSKSVQVSLRTGLTSPPIPCRYARGRPLRNAEEEVNTGGNEVLTVVYKP